VWHTTYFDILTVHASISRVTDVHDRRTMNRMATAN